MTIRGLVNVFAFPDNLTICPVQSLKEYLTRTAPPQYADANSLIIAHTKPHKSVSVQTLARSMTKNMAAAGMDISMFKQHSTRGASSAWLETGSETGSVDMLSGPVSPPYTENSVTGVLHTGWG